jgi:hypothetical protein
VSTTSISADLHQEQPSGDDSNDSLSAPKREKQRRVLDAPPKIAPTSTQLLFPLAMRTDSTTVIDGRRISLPQVLCSSDSDSRVPVPPTTAPGSTT